MGTPCSVLRVKTTGTSNGSLTPSSAKNEWSYTSSLLYAFHYRQREIYLYHSKLHNLNQWETRLVKDKIHKSAANRQTPLQMHVHYCYSGKEMQFRLDVLYRQAHGQPTDSSRSAHGKLTVTIFLTPRPMSTHLFTPTTIPLSRVTQIIASALRKDVWPKVVRLVPATDCLT